jgi:YHS domain-containing protein
MQVEIEHAPASRVTNGQTVYFCSDHCADRYDTDPHAGHAVDEHAGHGHDGRAGEVDPVCGMTVDPATAQHTVERDGGTIYFCGPGCRAAFLIDPDAYRRAPAEATGGASR